MILNCESRDHAHSIANADPFAEKGYYQDRSILEVEPANADNNYLL
ncbi:YciI family protein [Halocatena halophila]